MCGDFHDGVVIAITAVDLSLVNDWHDHERDLERQSWVAAAAAEQESRFGRVVVITAVGQFDQDRLAERGAALQWGLNGRTHHHSGLNASAVRNRPLRGPRLLEPRAVVSICDQFRDGCDMQQSVALKGG